MAYNVDYFKSVSGCIKLANVAIILISIAIFFSEYASWYQFVGTILVSGLVYTVGLMLTYILGGHVIQKTLYEVLLNTYFALMFLIAAIVNWANSDGKNAGTPVATGVLSLAASIIYAVDVYIALVNVGAMISGTASTQRPQPQDAVVTPTPINVTSGSIFPSSNNQPATLNPTSLN